MDLNLSETNETVINNISNFSSLRNQTMQASSELKAIGCDMPFSRVHPSKVIAVIERVFDDICFDLIQAHSNKALVSFSWKKDILFNSCENELRNIHKLGTKTRETALLHHSMLLFERLDINGVLNDLNTQILNIDTIESSMAADFISDYLNNELPMRKTKKHISISIPLSRWAIKDSYANRLCLFDNCIRVISTYTKQPLTTGLKDFIPAILSRYSGSDRQIPAGQKYGVGSDIVIVALKKRYELHFSHSAYRIISNFLMNNGADKERRFVATVDRLN